MTVRVQAEPFDPGAETAAFAAGGHDSGGIASFLGLVRGHHHGTPVLAMTLEHYPGMTEKGGAGKEAGARRGGPLNDVLLVPRHGRMLPGEPIVLVLTASAHRAAALDACAFLIDWLKTRAPFWKLEETPDGERWVEARASDDEAAENWTEAAK